MSSKDNVYSSFSISYASILNLSYKYEEREAIKLINKSFYSFQNKFETYNLKKNFKSKLQILKDLNYFERKNQYYFLSKN